MPSADKSEAKTDRGCVKYVVIFAALVTATATITAALINKLPNIQFPWASKATSCGPSPDLQWTSFTGDWSYYGGLARFGTKKGPRGLLMSGIRLAKGTIESTIKLPGYQIGCKAQLVYGFKSTSEDYLTAGLGGRHATYSMGEVRSGTDWHQLVKRGDGGGLSESQDYTLKLYLENNKATLEVNGVRVAESLREADSPLSEIGIWVEGCKGAEFICTRVCSE